MALYPARGDATFASRRTGRRPMGGLDMRATYLFIDVWLQSRQATKAPRFRPDDGPLPPIRAGAFARWAAAGSADPETARAGEVEAGTSRRPTIRLANATA